MERRHNEAEMRQQVETSAVASGMHMLRQMFRLRRGLALVAAWRAWIGWKFHLQKQEKMLRLIGHAVVRRKKKHGWKRFVLFASSQEALRRELVSANERSLRKQAQLDQAFHEWCTEANLKLHTRK